MNKGWNKMTEDEVLAEFRASNALLEGHFLLSSGRHSATTCNAPAC
jgi:orotate phosphoribosyltransferase